MTEQAQRIVRRNCQLEGVSIPRHFRQFHAPNFVGTVWGWPL
ncbi:unnamed protein product, partial [Staurois parvus]